MIQIFHSSIRYKSSEESLFQEKESVRSQLEMLHEEKAKLSRVGDFYVQEIILKTGLSSNLKSTLLKTHG